MGMGSMRARSTVNGGVRPGTELGLLCSQARRTTGGALAVPGAGGKTVQIDGVILNMTPTWVVGAHTATNVSVSPGDTIVWRAVAGNHGVVFDTEALAKAFLTFETGGSLAARRLGEVGRESVWGTAP